MEKRFALPLLRQIEHRGGLSGSLPPAHLQYLQKQLIQLSRECLVLFELERQQKSFSEVVPFLLPRPDKVAGSPGGDEPQPTSSDQQDGSGEYKVVPV